MKNNENWSTKELVNFLNQSNEALRIENKRLMDEVERMTMNIEVHNAEIISDYYGQNFYTFTKSNTNTTFKTN
jgi:YHS domain-containing protein